jgi:hypothetical protein
MSKDLYISKKAVLARLFYAQADEITRIDKDFYYFRDVFFEIRGGVDLKKRNPREKNQYAKVEVNGREWYIREIRSKSKYYKGLKEKIK